MEVFVCWMNSKGYCVNIEGCSCGQNMIISKWFFCNQIMTLANKLFCLLIALSLSNCNHLKSFGEANNFTFKVASLSINKDVYSKQICPLNDRFLPRYDQIRPSLQSDIWESKIWNLLSKSQIELNFFVWNISVSCHTVNIPAHCNNPICLDLALFIYFRSFFENRWFLAFLPFS